MTKRDERYVSLPEAARRLGCSRQTIYTMLADGRLQGRMVAGRLVVLAASLKSVPKCRVDLVARPHQPEH